MLASKASKVARHENHGVKSPPETSRPPQKTLHFLATSLETNDFIKAVRVVAEIGLCFKVRATSKDSLVVTVEPIGIVAYLKKQIIIPAAGRYEFK